MCERLNCWNRPELLTWPLAPVMLKKEIHSSLSFFRSIAS